MNRIKGDLERIRKLLRAKLIHRGFTQREVQRALGWGRSHISKLVTGQSHIRVEQLLLILKFIGVPPEEFWSEVYPLDERTDQVG